MAKRWNQGLFKVHNRDKYIGNPDHIIYRSGWELKTFIALDKDPNVIRWASEQIAIPYVNPYDKKVHRYYPDLYVERAINNRTEIFIIEIKPKKETQRPKAKSRRQLLRETYTYNINQSKWNAAQIFCDLKRWKFEIHTEETLFAR